ncbi:hypothetical protein [Spiroplasma endosymbiont of Megaselia nigra]|uniref:hypothetical protein n=1 Tax=Spiroplasma endosymbiont of Megaselia nigra TaxID=2478537 RepID=UPI000F85E015|nr:hypothetical protein [Spiroplasma endosymbiont of Megaselia nigra]RUO85982.1 hypothetical protein D9R21_05715 [Spiroplasma endosymbiont of Megaselia nigra]
MKKLFSLLSILTITGTAVPTTIAASPYQNQNNNFEILTRVKRQYDNIQRIEPNNGTPLSSIQGLVLNLGRIRIYDNRNAVEGDQTILNAFININRNILSREIRDTNNLYVSGRSYGSYSDTATDSWAHISLFGQPYNPVLVTFIFPTIRNTESNIQRIPSRPQQQPISEPGYNWSSRLNLSTQYLTTNLGNIFDTRERTIIQSFLLNNQNLPTELINILRVSNVSRSSATIYVPEGNLRYEGNLIVSFSTNQNSYYGSGDL